MIVFLYLLAALGVSYWAKIYGRNTWIWFVLSIVTTPLGGIVLIALADWLSPSSR